LALSIQNLVSLQPYNTFGIDESAAFFCTVDAPDQLAEALAFASERSLEVLILGGGSNILFTRSFQGLVIQICNRGIASQRVEEKLLVDVAAGENWHAFVLHSLSQGWFGLENLSLIPGQVGAAPMQNIGAYGVEVGNLIDSVTYYDRQTGKMESLPGNQCRFGYRESIFKHELKNRAIIWSVCFALSSKPNLHIGYGDIQKVLADKGLENPTPKDVSEAVMQIRQSKLPDPAQVGNAGSFFKNPVVPASILTSIQVGYPSVPFYNAPDGHFKIPAGWLIETAGWKGRRLGNAGVHDRQALVLVNGGGATGADILNLATAIQNSVKDQFGILLQPEVNFV